MMICIWRAFCYAFIEKRCKKQHTELSITVLYTWNQCNIVQRVPFHTKIHSLKKARKVWNEIQKLCRMNWKKKGPKIFKWKSDAVTIYCISSVKWNKTWWGILKGFRKPTVLFLVINLKGRIDLKSQNDFFYLPWGLLGKEQPGDIHCLITHSLTHSHALWARNGTRPWTYDKPNPDVGFPICCLAK